LAAAAGEVPALELAAADGEVPALELAAADGEVSALELAAAVGEAAEDVRFTWEERAGKRQRILVGAVCPTPAENEPIDAAIARGDVICSPRSAAWAREVALEDGEVDPVRAPLTRPLLDTERGRCTRAVQYTLSGTPVPGAAPAPSSPHPSIWDAPEAADIAEEGEEEEPAHDGATDAEEGEEEPARDGAIDVEEGEPRAPAEQDVQAEFDALFANAHPPSPGADFNAALDQLEEDLRSPEQEVVGDAVDDPYGGTAEPQECDMYAALAGALSDEENVETPAHGEEHRVGFDWVNHYRDEDANACDPQVWVGGPRLTPPSRLHRLHTAHTPLLDTPGDRRVCNLGPADVTYPPGRPRGEIYTRKHEESGTEG
jgi:hypothetical protein